MYDKWMETKRKIKELTEQLHEIEADIWIEANKLGQINPEGSKTFSVDGYKVTITHKNTVKVDQAIASDYPYLFKQKLEFSNTLYKTLTEGERKIVDEAITITPSKPGFSVEKV